MEKINIAELLKDCPRGMELDCTMYEDVTLYKINDSPEHEYPIRIETKNGHFLDLTKHGTYTDIDEAKCVIFPKGKTTWEGFQQPFKDGDVVTGENCACSYIAIFKEFIDDTSFSHYACLTSFGKFSVDGISDNASLRLATPKENEKLFDAINDKGYRWNDETKSLVKWVKPKFKVGNRIKAISNSTQLCQYLIIGITDTHYTLEEVEDKFKYTEPIGNDKNWELVANKFDINTLKPFESRVLVRDCDAKMWKPTFWGKYLEDFNYRYLTTNGSWKQCIPYEGNEHLLGTTENCNEYFKNWE